MKRVLALGVLLMAALGVALLLVDSSPNETRVPLRIPTESANLMFDAYPEYSEGGYTDKRTVLQGDEIRFYLANTLERFPARVLRATGYLKFEVMRSIPSLTGNSPGRRCTPEEGCEWDLTLTLTVPREWPSGWYRLEFPVGLSREPRYVDFIVAEREPSSPLLFIFDTQTAQAYNVYAGGSFYGRFDEEGRWSRGERKEIQATRLSWLRPVVRAHTYEQERDRIRDPYWIPHEEEAFRAWLDERFDVAYASNDALTALGPEYLARYRAVVVVGTQEYWSNAQVRLLEAYVLAGGNLYLSAVEFAYGTVRFEGDGNTFVFYKNPLEDPLLATQPSEVATLRAATANTGLFFGVSLQPGVGLADSDQFARLIVADASHWAFEGLGYKTGDELAGVRGLGIGTHLQMGPYGTLCIVWLPCEQVSVLAAAEYPSYRSESEGRRDALIHGERKFVLAEASEFTHAVVALIRQGRGSIFVAPGGWFNSPHAQNQDPRVRQLIERVLRAFVSGVRGR
jgi:hypothetical protein